MPYEIAAKNLMLDALRPAISHVSLHSGVPTRANEVSGADYMRQRTEFGPAVGGALRLSEGKRFEVSAKSRVNHAGFWTGAKGGVLLCWGSLDEVLFAERGVYVLDAGVLDLKLEGA